METPARRGWWAAVWAAHTSVYSPNVIEPRMAPTSSTTSGEVPGQYVASHVVELAVHVDDPDLLELVRPLIPHVASSLGLGGNPKVQNLPSSQSVNPSSRRRQCQPAHGA